MAAMEGWRWKVSKRKDRTVVMSMLAGACDVTPALEAELHLRSEDRRAKKWQGAP